MLIFTNFHQFLIKKTTIMNKLFIIFSCMHKNDVFLFEIEKESIEQFYTIHTEKLFIFVIHKHTVKYMSTLRISKLL